MLCNFWSGCGQAFEPRFLSGPSLGLPAVWRFLSNCLRGSGRTRPIHPQLEVLHDISCMVRHVPNFWQNYIYISNFIRTYSTSNRVVEGIIGGSYYQAISVLLRSVFNVQIRSADRMHVSVLLPDQVNHPEILFFSYCKQLQYVTAKYDGRSAYVLCASSKLLKGQVFEPGLLFIRRGEGRTWPLNSFPQCWGMCQISGQFLDYRGSVVPYDEMFTTFLVNSPRVHLFISRNQEKWHINRTSPISRSYGTSKATPYGKDNN